MKLIKTILAVALCVLTVTMLGGYTKAPTTAGVVLNYFNGEDVIECPKCSGPMHKYSIAGSDGSYVYGCEDVTDCRCDAILLDGDVYICIDGSNKNYYHIDLENGSCELIKNFFHSVCILDDYPLEAQDEETVKTAVSEEEIMRIFERS